jgi:hypothetical protein
MMEKDAILMISIFLESSKMKPWNKWRRRRHVQDVEKKKASKREVEKLLHS